VTDRLTPGQEALVQAYIENASDVSTTVQLLAAVYAELRYVRETAEIHRKDAVQLALERKEARDALSRGLMVEAATTATVRADFAALQGDAARVVRAFERATEHDAFDGELADAIANLMANGLPRWWEKA